LTLFRGQISEDRQRKNLLARRFGLGQLTFTIPQVTEAVLQMENSRVACGHRSAEFRKFKTNRQSKGHNAEVATFVDGITKGGASPIPFTMLSNIRDANLAAAELTQMKKTVELAPC